MLRQTCYYHYFSVVLCSFSSLFLSLYIFFFFSFKYDTPFFSRSYIFPIRVSRVSQPRLELVVAHTHIHIHIIKLRTMDFQLYTEMQQSSCNVLFLVLGIESLYVSRGKLA